jgi:uracil-DNA glycosylase family 4
MLGDVCKTCRLWEDCRSPFMSSFGSEEPVVLVVGEAPGEEEDAQNRPFVGKAGKLLTSILTEVGFDIKRDVRFTNVVRCRPPQNKITKKAIGYCARFVIDEIEKYNPTMVFLMGNSPLSGILGESGISNWNGVIIERFGRSYVPLYHPAYLLRNPQPMDQWFNGMLNALDKVTATDKKTIEQISYYYPKTVKELTEMQKYLDEFEVISYDTEVRYLNAFDKDNLLISVSFAAGDRAYSYPIGHKESPWKTQKQFEEVKDITVNCLKSHDKHIIGHNVKFDQLQTYALLNYWFEAGGDTMLISYILDSRRGIHGLKRLAGIHIGMYEYDSELWDYIADHQECNVKKKDKYGRNKGSYEHVPLNILEKYGAMDATATLLLDEKLYAMMTEKQVILYEELLMGMSNFLAEIESNGFEIDEHIATRYLKIYKTKRLEIYVNDISTDEYVVKLINIKNKVKRELNDERVGKGLKPKKIIKYKFNPGSSFHMAELVYKVCKMPVKVLTKTGLPCTKATVLKEFIPEMPVLESIRKYQLLSKMISTYLEPAVDGTWIYNTDGKVRSSYNIHVTKTGRLSSGDPNLQNIPAPDKEPGTILESLPIKNIFRTSFEDGVIIILDQSGMELRIFAALSHCEPMLEIHKSGRDFHKMVASMVTKIPYDEVPRPVRYKFKRVNWTLLYGGSAYTLANLDGFPADEAEAIFKAYYRQFPEVPAYMDKCIEFAEDHGYIESPFGRKETLFYINDTYQAKLQRADRRACVNMPIQSAASDIVMCGGIISNIMMKHYGFQAKIVNTVHDSLVIDCPRKEVDNVASVVKICMEEVVKLSPKYFPRLDFSWLDCPLHVDIEKGTHYGTSEDEKGYEIPETILSKYRSEILSVRPKSIITKSWISSANHAIA